MKTHAISSTCRVRLRGRHPNRTRHGGFSVQTPSVYRRNRSPLLLNAFESFRLVTPASLRDSLLSVAPLVAVFFLLQISVIKIESDTVRIYLGMFFCYIGLTIFMIGVMGVLCLQGTFWEQSWSLSKSVGLPSSPAFSSMVTVIAEPCSSRLNAINEEVTEGVILRKVVLTFLSIGVAFAVMLSVIRIYTPGLHLWHILLPGYILVMIMSYFTPISLSGLHLMRAVSHRDR